MINPYKTPDAKLDDSIKDKSFILSFLVTLIVPVILLYINWNIVPEINNILNLEGSIRAISDIFLTFITTSCFMIAILIYKKINGVVIGTVLSFAGSAYFIISTSINNVPVWYYYASFIKYPLSFILVFSILRLLKRDNLK